MTELANDPPRQRRRPLACQRCRKRKVRCDALLPSCSNCLKANVPCEEVQGSDRNHTHHLESRIQWLENIVRNVAPDFPIEYNADNEQQSMLQQQHQVATSEVPYQFRHQTRQPHGVGCGFEPGAQASQTVPAVSPDATHQVNSEARLTPRGNGQSPITPSAASHISFEQPLAQSVGLISLGHSTDPKYLGPSSGVSFARLIFAAAPPTQGLPIFSSTCNAPQNGSQEHTTSVSLESRIAQLPPLNEVSHFISAYADAFHHLYPFLSEVAIEQLIELAASIGPDSRDDIDTSRVGNADRVILYLVISLGARTLECQMNTDFSSTKYLDTAMELMLRVQMHESIKGIQIMLLLALATFIFPTAPNAWFLVSTIIASCVDLGLQRKQVSSQASETDEIEQNTRRGVFWSAYSLDRTLCTTLGRPLTLRDEAIDIEYPGEGGSNELTLSGVNATRMCRTSQRHELGIPIESSGKRRRLDNEQNSTYAPSIFSFRFDRIVAEIKLMIYRVAQVPERFPWPRNLSEWQQHAFKALQQLLEEARHTLRPSRLFSRGSYSDQVLPTLELKYHHCVTILFRPSPAFPRPTSEALQICFESASDTIRIHSDLLRFGRLNNSWLAAHTVFVSGITMLYYAWVNPHVIQSTSSDFYRQQKSCSEVLAALGRTWSVAKDAQEKFDKLLEITKKERMEGIRDSDNAYTQSDTPVDPLLSGDGQTSSRDVPLMDSDLGQFDASWGPTALWDELGDMKSWFDLEWFGDNLEFAGDYT